MKRFLVLFVLLSFLAAAAFAEESESIFSIGGVTDGYIIGGVDGGKMTAGQDVNLDIGPVYFDVTADWTAPLPKGDNTLALAYTLGYSQAFGAFTPKLELTGDQSFTLAKGVDPTGDWFSDLMPSINITFGKVGIDAYSDLSFEKGYKFLQTVDASGFANVGSAAFRVGILYMDPQAVTDDVGHPNGPAVLEGVSLYAKASVSY